MEKLSNPQKTIEIIKKYEFAFQKKFGQNFLIDEHVLNKIIAASEITKDDFVLEIGPGIGTMTQYLAEAAGKVAAANIDAYLGFDHKISSDVEIPPAHFTNTPPCGRVNLKSNCTPDCKGNFSLVVEGMSQEEAHQESSRCLRCDHFGFGSFKGGRNTEW